MKNSDSRTWVGSNKAVLSVPHWRLFVQKLKQGKLSIVAQKLKQRKLSEVDLETEAEGIVRN